VDGWAGCVGEVEGCDEADGCPVGLVDRLDPDPTTAATDRHMTSTATSKISAATSLRSA